MAKFNDWINEEGLLKVEGWARDGLTDEQIAKNIGISYSTLKEWKKKFSDFSATLKRGKEVIDRQVENALLKRALGYVVEEKEYIEESLSDVEIAEIYAEQKMLLKDANPDWTLKQIEDELSKTPKVKKKVHKIRERHVQGDTTAQIFWLKNRKPSEYRDKRQVEVSGGINVTNLTDEQLQEKMKKLEGVTDE